MSKIRIKLVKSSIDHPATQKRTLIALGLRKVYHSVELESSPQILGMVAKVKHLVSVETI